MQTSLSSEDQEDDLLEDSPYSPGSSLSGDWNGDEDQEEGGTDDKNLLMFDRACDEFNKLFEKRECYFVCHSTPDGKMMRLEIKNERFGLGDERSMVLGLIPNRSIVIQLHCNLLGSFSFENVFQTCANVNEVETDFSLSWLLKQRIGDLLRTTLPQFYYEEVFVESIYDDLPPETKTKMENPSTVINRWINESDHQPLDHPFSELSRAPASTTTDYEYTPAKLREYAEMLAALAGDEEQARQVREGVEAAIRNGNRYRFFDN